MNIDSWFIIVTLPGLVLSGARRCAEIRHVNHASSDDGDTQHDQTRENRDPAK